MRAELVQQSIMHEEDERKRMKEWDKDKRNKLGDRLGLSSTKVVFLFR